MLLNHDKCPRTLLIGITQPFGLFLIVYLLQFIPVCFITTTCSMFFASEVQSEEKSINQRPCYIHTEKIDYMNCEKQTETYMARNFPSSDTLKADIGSRTMCFELIRFQDLVFHFTILPPRSSQVKKCPI